MAKKQIQNIFKQAIIYYPKDEKIMKQINKEIASFHCAAIVKYMDSIRFNDEQKAVLIDSVLEDMRQDILSDGVTKTI